MLTVSDTFHESEQADVNRPSAKVYLVLGNYATAAFGGSATASGASANYPASGAIDGDRTELNVGPASGADNDVGQSSWQSAIAPDTTPQTLKIDLGQARTINRIKLYHRASHGLSNFKIEGSTNDADYTLIAKTTNQGGTLTTTGEVDTIDFDDASYRYVLLTISGTAVAADMANVIEFEIYRLLDVSDRAISVKTGRARDYQLTNFLASTATVIFTNVDKYFSPSYVATLDSETDFINSELKPGIGLIVKYGYDYTGHSEHIQNFIGTVDKITIKPGTRTATFDCRDAMKAAFNLIVSTKLKTSQDSGDLILFMLNKANISTWETDVDQTGITIDYFFSEEQSIIETIRSLVEGAGDATFFIDENGIAQFHGFMGLSAHESTDSESADFSTGALTNIDLTTEPGKIKRKWFRFDDFADGNFTSNPVWTTDQLPFVLVGSRLRRTTGGGGTGEAGHISTPQPYATGTWQFSLASAPSIINVNFIAQSYVSNGGGPEVRNYSNSYVISYSEASGSGAVGLSRYSSIGLIETVIGSYGISGGTGSVTIRVSRNSSGLFKVYVNGVLRIEATDNTYTTSSILGVMVRETTTPTDYAEIYDIHYSPTIDNDTEATTDQSVFISSAIDQTAQIALEGLFQATTIVPSGTAVAFYTATSDDDITYDAFLSVSPGDQIQSTPRRYIKWKAVLTCPVEDGNHNFILTTPTITDVSINWNETSGASGGSTPKYPDTVSFTFDESLNIDLDQIYADTVAGGSAIVNSITVKAQPLISSGSDTDVKWQGTSGTPPKDISVTDPLGVTSGQTLTYRIFVNGGMDTSLMSGANPAAAAITFAGGGAGSWFFSSIHPTKPVLVITISGTGTITNLQLHGKGFESDSKFLEAESSDDDSIQEFGERKSDISNEFITNSALAQQIADRIIDNLSNPITYTPQIKVRPTYSIQIGDRITLTDSNLGISEDNIVIGVEQFLGATINGADAYTVLKLLKI